MRSRSDVDGCVAMGERRVPQRTSAKMGRATAIILLASATVLPSAPECFAHFPPDTPRTPEVSPPSNPRTSRARTRIRVTPAYPYRTYPTTYPVPYTYEYPGPGH